MSPRLLLVLLLAVLLPRPVAAELPDGNWKLLSHAVPPAVAPGAQLDVDIRLQNRSDLTWSEQTKDRLSYHWRAEDGAMLEWDGRRTLLPAPLAPGDAVTVRMKISAPGEPGRYWLQLEPVREQRRWWGPPSFTRDVVIPVEVVPTIVDLAWSLEQLQPLPPLSAGAQVSVPLRLHNVGDSAWSTAAGDRLAYHWIDGDGRRIEGVRTSLPGPVDPGETVLLAARLLAPAAPGTYTLIWEPVREHVRWYGPPRGAPATLTARVGPPVERFTVDPPAADLHARTVSELDVLVVNHGDTWPEGHGLALSYHWRRPDGSVLEYDGLRTPLPALQLGEEQLVTARVLGPDEPGPYILEWAAVRDGVGWYEPDAPQLQRIDVLPPLLGWELRAVDWPWTMPVGREEAIRVRLRNTGLATLSPTTGDRLTYRWRAADDLADDHEGVRTELPADLPPGASVSLPLRIAGPPRTGRYTLELALVREHVAWAPPPTGLAHTARIFVVRRSDLMQLALVALTVVAVGLARRRRLSPAALRRLPAVWLWASTAVTSVGFAELAGLHTWRGGLAISTSAAALPALLVLAAPGRLRPAVAFLLATLLATLLFADLLYMQLLGSIVPVQALIASHQVGDIGASITALAEPAYLWLATPILTGLLLLLAWPRVPADRLPRAATLTVAALAPVPLVVAMVAAMAGPLGNRVFSEQHNVGRFGVVGAHVFDLLRTVRERLFRAGLSPERLAAVERWYAARPPPEHGAHFGAARGHNLLVIQAEAMQGWVLGARLGDQEITPFLNRLRGQALHYSALADETAQGMTSDAEYAFLNSQLPLGQGAVAFLRADNHFHTLAHALRDAGYATLSAHPFKKGFWNRAVLHPRYGFDRSLFAEDLGPGPTIGWGLSDDAFFQRMLPELAPAPRPFFAFLVTLSLHHPYDHFPEGLKQLQLGPLEGSALGNYLHGMHYLDRSLARLFAALAQLGLSDDTVVAIYGDHDSRLAHTPELLQLAGLTAWSPAVPLQLDRIAGLVVLPGAPVHGEVDAVGGHVDLAPTLLHYLGLSAPPVFIGAPLLPEHPERGLAVFSDGSAIGEGRAFTSAGRGISQTGACFEHPSWRPLPLAECEALARHAQETLYVSRAVVDHDLAHRLGR